MWFSRKKKKQLVPAQSWAEKYRADLVNQIDWASRFADFVRTILERDYPAAVTVSVDGVDASFMLGRSNKQVLEYLGEFAVGMKLKYVAALDAFDLNTAHYDRYGAAMDARDAEKSFRRHDGSVSRPDDGKMQGNGSSGMPGF